MQEFSKSKINDLGKRLRTSDSPTGEDIALLNAYRNSFGEAFQIVTQKLAESGAFPTERSKSTLSIVQKLRREKTMSLSAMQDIAGCRVIVKNVAQQDQFVATLGTAFEVIRLIDRREKPSHGYRAVHVIPKVMGKPVEIQIRTQLQDMWARLSEKASDVLGHSIKYGGGDEIWQALLAETSSLIAEHENTESWVHKIEEHNKKITNSFGYAVDQDLNSKENQYMMDAESWAQRILLRHNELIRFLEKTSSFLDTLRGQEP